MPVRQCYGDLPDPKPRQSSRPNPCPPCRVLRLGAVRFAVTATQPPLLQITAGNENVVWLPESSFAQQDALVKQGVLPTPPNVLWWSGGTVGNRFLQALQPYGAIASHFRVKKGDLGRLERLKIPTFVTGQAGAVEWRPGRGFAAGRQESTS
jgi:hypothetical protein